LVLGGRFPSTNKVHELLLSEGAYRAKAGRKLPPHESYSGWAHNVVVRTLAEARRSLQPVPLGVPVDVGVFLLCHSRYDADAWTAVGKWALDGIVRAGVIASDRRDVNFVRGRCFSTVEQSDAWARGRGLPAGRQMLVVELDEVRL
jgi:hypothetical protein